MTTTIPVSNPDQRNHLIGMSMVLLAAFGFSAKAILVKIGYQWQPGLDPIVLMALRMGFSLPLFLLVAHWNNGRGSATKPRRRDWLSLLVVGLLGYYLASLLDFTGLQYISAGLERLILFVYPTLVVLLSALFLGRAIGRRELIALLLSYAGIAIVYGQQLGTGPPGGEGATAWGALLVFASALSFALFIMGSGELIRRFGSVRFTTGSMSVAAVAVLLHYGMSYAGTPAGIGYLLDLPAGIYGLALLMAVASTVLPAFLMSAGIHRIGAGRAAIVGGGGPVMTLVLAWIVLGEVMTPLQLFGTGLVLAGVWNVGRR
jgi:drug/metabolite transporter (DMT)-like permease